MKRLSANLWMLVLLIPAAVLLPMAGNLIYQKGAEFSDLAISHLPNALWIQKSVSQWGQIPLWSNTILAGYPFAANPLSGLHYPPGWIALFFPLPLGINLVLLLHLVLGGVGAFRFLRAEGIDRHPALLGGLAFGSLPKLLAHLGAGHVTLVYAVCWTPWLLLAERRSDGKVWPPAVVLGLIALADPRWAALAGMLWIIYRLKFAHSYGGALSVRIALHWFGRTGTGVLLAVLLSAGLLVPLLEYTRLSTRTILTPEETLVYSLPPAQLIGFLTPPVGGTPEYVLYPGSIILALALVGISIPEARRRAGFWYGIALVTLLISFGSAIPGAGIIASLPGFNLLRVPTRALFICGLALVITAAWTWHVISRDPAVLRNLARFNPFLALTGLVIFALTLTGLGWWVTGEFPLRFAWGGLGLGGSLILLSLYRAGKIKNTVGGWLLIGWLLIDLFGSNLLGLDLRLPVPAGGQGEKVAEALRAENGLFRIYSPSYSVSQQTAAQNDLELADGVDPLQLRSYVEFMRSATGIFSPGYSVTLPTYETGRPGEDNRLARPDPRLLGLVNVMVVASEFPLEVPGLQSIGQVGSTFLYRNLSAYPRAWVQPVGTQPGTGEYGPASVEWSPNRITVSASGPGRLILSEIAYPGWEARIDGKPVPLLTTVIFRAVDLPSGPHEVVFAFRPASVYAGGGISILSWLGVLFFYIRSKKRVR